MTDVHVDRPRLPILGAASDRFEQRLPREHPPRTARQRPEQLEFDVGELDRPTVELDRAPRRIDVQPVDLDGSFLLRLLPWRGGTAKDRADAAAELADREGLGDVVVGAQLE